jgi:hypothetical protein
VLMFAGAAATEVAELMWSRVAEFLERLDG